MAIVINDRREPLWDYTVVDKEKSTATLSVNRLERGEIVYDFDAPWEGNAYYPTVIRDGDKYSMYYGAGQGSLFREDGSLDESLTHVCRIESFDGLHWKRPTVDKFAFGEYTHNNVVLDHDEARDSLSVFIDENPECPAERKYKGLVRAGDGCKVFLEGGALACYASADGDDFERIEDVSREPGKFDSLNTVYYDGEAGLYKLFHRDFEDGRRAIRYKTSRDFSEWRDEGLISFDDEEKFQLYTNNIKQYPRAPHVYVGFPVRYVERREWTANYEQMPDLEFRKSLLDNKDYRRGGLALTDTLFMTSRDGKRWHRFPEAFLDAGIEEPFKWRYGSCYLSHGFVESGSRYLFYSVERHSNLGEPVKTPARLRVYSIRLDGFASFKAPYSGARVVTKPIVFKGSELSINFRTSASGSIYVRIRDNEGGEISSCELFGNNVDRRVPFSSDLSAFAGKEVTLEFDMRDAEIYSFKFE